MCKFNLKIQSSTVQEDEIQPVYKRNMKNDVETEKIQNAHSTHKPNIQTQCTNLRYKHKNTILKLGKKKTEPKKKANTKIIPTSTAYKHNKQHNKQNATNYNTKKKSRFRLCNAANKKTTI